jgi:CheY-like chemotaxis protein
MAKVLVVDDERDGAEAVATFFHSLGHETATAHNGLEALEISIRFKPDVVILDVEMPLLDGFQAARCLRERSNSGQPLLVAVTAIASADVATHRAFSSGLRSRRVLFGSVVIMSISDCSWTLSLRSHHAGLRLL